MLTNTTMFKKLGIITTIMLALMTFETSPLFAKEHDEQHDENQERNWELMLGPGSLVMPEYKGSDEMEITPFPLIFGEVRFGNWEVFVKTDQGVGLTVAPSPALPLNFTVGVNMGEGRDRKKASFLAGTPNINNSVQVFGEVETQSPFGKFTTALQYFPITAEYAVQADKDYTGLVVAVDWRKEWWPQEFLMFDVGTGLSWMNADYAEAYYSVLTPTSQLDAFQAQAGVQDVKLSTTAILFFSEHAGVGFAGDLTYLLNDAADSPLTQRTVQPFAALFAFYRF